MGWLWIALLACSVVVLIGAEWPRLAGPLGMQSRKKRERARRKSQFKLLKNESEEFAASVERDLSRLPTIDERD